MRSVHMYAKIFFNVIFMPLHEFLSDDKMDSISGGSSFLGRSLRTLFHYCFRV